MPGYGIEEEPAGLLTWEWAVERLAKSHNYWLSTTRPDGRPHAMPIWGVWLDDGFYFSSGKQSRKSRNLAANRECVISTESAAEAVIMEGKAEIVADRTTLQPFYRAYKAKYDWDMEQEPLVNEPVYRVSPRVVFGFTEEELTSDATRWTFD